MNHLGKIHPRYLHYYWTATLCGMKTLSITRPHTLTQWMWCYIKCIVYCRSWKRGQLLLLLLSLVLLSYCPHVSAARLKIRMQRKHARPRTCSQPATVGPSKTDITVISAAVEWKCNYHRSCPWLHTLCMESQPSTSTQIEAEQLLLASAVPDLPLGSPLLIISS